MAIFSRKYRLLKKVEFQQVFQHSKKKVTCSMIFRIGANDLKFPRLGMIVSKRNAGRAVDRNLIKRMLRECFRARQHQLGEVDIVVLILPRVKSLKKEELWERLNLGWNQLVTYREKRF